MTYRQKENIMNKNITLIGSSLLLLVSNISYADDLAETQQTHAQMQLQSRLQSMNNEERAFYKNLNGGGNEDGNGDMKRTRKRDGSGSGNQNRYGQSESGGYGAGYSSRQGNGSGGGRGRGH